MQRLHLECARSSLEDDAISAAANHARVCGSFFECAGSVIHSRIRLLQMATTLDYGGKLMDPAYISFSDAGCNIASSSSCYTTNDREHSMVALLDANVLPGGGDGRVVSLQRPLDREIIPLARSAALAAATYDEPSDPAELAQVRLISLSSSIAICAQYYDCNNFSFQSIRCP
jgi:hypothetical protein